MIEKLKKIDLGHVDEIGTLIYCHVHNGNAGAPVACEITRKSPLMLETAIESYNEQNDEHAALYARKSILDTWEWVLFEELTMASVETERGLSFQTAVDRCMQIYAAWRPGAARIPFCVPSTYLAEGPKEPFNCDHDSIKGGKVNLTGTVSLPIVRGMPHLVAAEAALVLNATRQEKFSVVG